MSFRLMITVASGCYRRNDIPVFAAVAISLSDKESSRNLTWPIPEDPFPTEERLDLIAMIYALQAALIRKTELPLDTLFHSSIFTDSTYAKKCMTLRMPIWRSGCFVDPDGRPEPNQDLVLQLVDLDKKLDEEDVCIDYIVITKASNSATRELMDMISPHTLEADVNCAEVFERHGFLTWNGAQTPLTDSAARRAWNRVV